MFWGMSAESEAIALQELREFTEDAYDNGEFHVLHTLLLDDMEEDNLAYMDKCPMFEVKEDTICLDSVDPRLKLCMYKRYISVNISCIIQSGTIE